LQFSAFANDFAEMSRTGRDAILHDDIYQLPGGRLLQVLGNFARTGKGRSRR
jgi:hypothetical protein